MKAAFLDGPAVELLTPKEKGSTFAWKLLAFNQKLRYLGMLKYISNNQLLTYIANGLKLLSFLSKKWKRGIYSLRLV